ncbi:MAG: DUF2442 domain-containing protein [Sedimentisphaerales bacterium]|nr:DUF2442 domain-containing protein [Sedimentisphaerales bacterium]
MKKYHKIEKISFVKGTLILGVDGKEYKFRLADISERLSKASPEEREKYEISPAGYGIHWLLIDEDLSIDGLIGIKHSQTRQKAVSVQDERYG